MIEYEFYKSKIALNYYDDAWIGTNGGENAAVPGLAEIAKQKQNDYLHSTLLLWFIFGKGFLPIR